MIPLYATVWAESTVLSSTTRPIPPVASRLRPVAGDDDVGLDLLAVGITAQGGVCVEGTDGARSGRLPDVRDAAPPAPASPNRAGVSRLVLCSPGARPEWAKLFW